MENLLATRLAVWATYYYSKIYLPFMFSSPPNISPMAILSKFLISEKIYLAFSRIVLTAISNLNAKENIRLLFFSWFFFSVWEKYFSSLMLKRSFNSDTHSVPIIINYKCSNYHIMSVLQLLLSSFTKIVISASRRYCYWTVSYLL